MLLRHYLLFVITIFIVSCGGYKNKSIKQEKKDKEIGLKSNSTLLQNGIDFTAWGMYAQAWEVKINFEDSIYFSSLDENKFTIATNKSKVTNKENELIINASLKLDSIKIVISKTYCSSKEKTQKVQIEYKKETYTGCGLYLQNMQLQNKWMLYKFRNEFVDHLKFVPTLILDLDNNKMEWKDGCNNIKSKIKVEGEKLFFNEIKQTTLSCTDTEITKVLMNNIRSGVATYYFKNDILYLYLLDDSVLMFKKSN